MRFRFRHSLFQALLVFVIVPMVLVLAVAGYAYLTTLEKRAEERLQGEVQLVARALKLPVRHALKREREGSVDSALESAFQINRVYGASVYDADGNKVASIGAQKGGERDEHELMADLAKEGGRQEEYGEVGGKEAYTYFLPLSDPGGAEHRPVTSVPKKIRISGVYPKPSHGIRGSLGSRGPGYNPFGAFRSQTSHRAAPGETEPLNATGGKR